LKRALEPIYSLTLVVVLAHVSYNGSRILISLFAISLDASAFVIGTLVSTYSIAPLAVAVYSGRLSDRLGYRRPMLWGCVGSVASLLLPFLFPGLPALYASALLLGGSFSLFNVAAQAFAGVVSTPETRARNFSTLSMGYSISGLIGPLVVGFGVDHAGPALTYAILAAVLLPAVALLVRKPDAFEGRGASAAAGSRSVVDLLRIRGLMAMFVASAACVTRWDLFTFFMPIYGTSIGLSASVIGIIISVFGIATLVVRVFIPMLTRRLGEVRLLGVALCVGAGAFALMPVLHEVWALVAVTFVMGLGLGCGQPLTMMLTYVRSPQGRAGEANGIRQMANNLTHLVIPTLFGALGSAAGMGAVFWTNAAVLVAGALAGTRRPR